MKSVIFKCEIITPLFMGGADGVTPELRPPSIKGAMRFWWRAMNGDLSLEQLRKQETELFGGVGKDESDGRRSAFNIRLENINLTPSGAAYLVPHKRTPGQSFQTKGTFEIVFSMFAETEVVKMEQVAAIFQLTCLLGGMGKRARRGMGSVCVVNCSDPAFFFLVQKANDLLDLLNKASANKKMFQKVSENLMVSNFRTQNQYPYIKQIDIGRPNAPKQTVETISQTTGNLHREHFNEYGASLGKAIGGRFASPVYASVANINDQFVPIVTTLNTVPDQDKHKVDNSLQEKFRKNIL